MKIQLYEETLINRKFEEDRQSTQRFWHANQIFGCLLLFFCSLFI